MIFSLLGLVLYMGRKGNSLSLPLYSVDNKLSRSTFQWKTSHLFPEEIEFFMEIGRNLPVQGNHFHPHARLWAANSSLAVMLSACPTDEYWSL